MNEQSSEDLEREAVAGDWQAAVSVLSRPSLKPEARTALQTPEAHDELRMALLAGADVAPGEIEWAASPTESTFILNRIVAHGRTDSSTISAIRDRSAEREGETWEMLKAYATRVLDRIAHESGLHGAH